MRQFLLHCSLVLLIAALVCVAVPLTLRSQVATDRQNVRITSVQQVKIADIQRETRKKIAALQDELLALEKAGEKERAGEHPNQAELAKLESLHKDILNRVEALRDKSRREVRELLTATQLRITETVPSFRAKKARV